MDESPKSLEDLPRKYMVFKRSDYLAAMDECQTSGAHIMLQKLEGVQLLDAEVIRHQDLTAAPIFWHYSQQLHTLIEMADAVGVPLASRSRLLEIASYFGLAAHAAEEHPNRKLPD